MFCRGPGEGGTAIGVGGGTGETKAGIGTPPRIAGGWYFEFHFISVVYLFSKRISERVGELYFKGFCCVHPMNRHGGTVGEYATR